MSHYQPLSTEKYYQATVRQEISQLRREKNRQAIQAFIQFLFVLVVFLLTVTAIQQMPVWLPVATAFMDQTGFAETFQTWVNQFSANAQ